MNMTPFIDVLLVLLIMLMLAIPVKFHSLDMPLPGQGTPGPILAQNSVTIDADDALYWNGTRMTRDALGRQLAGAAAMADQPVVRFEPDANASYDRSAKTIALIKDAGIERFAFVGNQRHREFGRAP
ncbi:Biopolymer transport protein ExbD/TolR [Erythrobacter litoralis HTCC2594]|uniref:Biopolymer transport protein ExbD/TolR n=2 Tax=Erythrobacter litoralis TaxID=39960 RepID=Q2N652_ERYLH|nr:Biopolymer transport protein ExbD/TolR [Erythrobacter litoralis HTCC2594]